MAGDGAAIPVTVHGNAGPVVILVHGWSCSAAFWDRQTEYFARDFRVVTLDLPGHGRANRLRPSGRWSMAQYGADVAAVADWTGADQVILVGHSMGGAVALESALRLGSRCRGLIGVDTFTEAAFYAGRPSYEISERQAVFGSDFASTMRGMIAAITGESTDPDLIDWIGSAMAATDPQAALSALEALLSWDIRPRWSLCSLPVTTINSAVLARRNELIELAGIDLRLMEGVGHFPMLENPSEFNALLSDVLKERLA
ncbi:alpha/beta hydrolase [Mesorhizobium sp. BR1-1-16]|uniref:alpha/beta fold hydrolase n=1 Tax=Mesorhizobium sp. BR1-1-16 TaxID=2876653 RepID=UPI001CC98AE4|nr:alpha/beta hydrolase [Mesorhizobium sp. BR1-1-16]MBZ9935739.1 alpha/beta hydrolase [Mesorhizobium sp. BR1-1-16]